MNDQYDVFEVAAVRIDCIVPPCVPIRVAKIDVEGGESAVLEGMEQIIGRERIDYIAIEIIRDLAGNSWRSLVDRLDHFTSERSARLATLDSRGRPNPIDITQIASSGAFSQIVVDFTR